jgi:beta-glucosidase
VVAAAIGVGMAMSSTTAVADDEAAAASAQSTAGLPYRDASLPVEQRVADLLSRMTLEEKVGQMTQTERYQVFDDETPITTYGLGSILSGGGSTPTENTPHAWADMVDRFQQAALETRLGIPLIYGIDAVHGNGNMYGSTIFPHNIGLGATRDPALVRRAAHITAEETRATGPQWNFAPCICAARDDRWGRTYESFSEDPDLVIKMETAIDGYQGPEGHLDDPDRMLATAKHYAGDGDTEYNPDAEGYKIDQGIAITSREDFWRYSLRQYVPAVKKHDVGSVMPSFSSVDWTEDGVGNPIKMHANRELITDVLKRKIGFDGFVISDWEGIHQIPGDWPTQVRTGVNAGTDMFMEPNTYQSFITTLIDEVNAGRVPMSRIDDAVSRILTKKFELGLFEDPYADRTYASTIGSAAHRALARQAVRESQVLLKNAGGVLPLAKSGGKIFVAGKSADDIGNQSGGWTLSWQGASGNTVPGTSILAGIRSAVGSGATVTYTRDGTGIDSSYRAAIAVVGETPYAEGEGDRPGSMSLDATDLATVNRLRAAGVPVIVVLVSGRPLDIAAEVGNWNALVAAWLPGSEGAGVADVLFGDHAPTGKLPMTWMQSASQQPINDGDGKTALFPYGFGLTYGTTTADTAAPSVPGAPVASAVTATGLTLTWPASTDTGGSGLAGYDVYRNGTLIGSPATASYPVTGLTADTRYEFTVVARDAAGNRSAASPALAVTSAPSGTTTGGACRVSAWSLQWSFTAGQTVTQSWSARVTQSGATVTATGEPSGSSLAPGATVSFGFNGSHAGSNPRPAAFTLNGGTCAIE